MKIGSKKCKNFPNFPIFSILTIFLFYNLLRKSENFPENKYIKFHFKDPEMHKDLIVSFVTHDSKANRSDRESYKTLTKLINKNLEGTNWRLTGDISYRLGMLEGRLKAYEKDEDLIKLVKPKNGDLSNIML